MDIGQCLRHPDIDVNIASQDSEDMYFAAVCAMGITKYKNKREMLDDCEKVWPKIQAEETKQAAQSMLVNSDAETGARIAEDTLEALLLAGVITEEQLPHDADGKCPAMDRINARKVARAMLKETTE